MTSDRFVYHLKNLFSYSLFTQELSLTAMCTQQVSVHLEMMDYIYISKTLKTLSLFWVPFPNNLRQLQAR